MSDPGAPYRLMARNNAWANATLYGAISDQVWDRPAPGFFGSMSRTMNHLYEVDLYYVDALQEGGLGRSVYQREDVTNPGALATLQAMVDARLIAFCDQLTVETLAETRATERKDATSKEGVEPLLLHLFQHQIHHRGQAHTQLHHAGITPPQLDDFHLEFGRVPSAEDYLRV